MQINFKKIRLHKRYPLVISRGATATSENLFVTLQRDPRGPIGIGELGPATGSAEEADEGIAWLTKFVADAETVGAFFDNPHSCDAAMRQQEIPESVRAAMDIALWDLLAKESGLPLYRMFGLPKTAVATSLTVGLNPLEVTRERVPEILARTGAKFLKVKLGSPEGIEFDQAHLSTVTEMAGPGIRLRVDANGGWTVDEAMLMMRWLKERGVDYVEQPLPEGQEVDLLPLFEAKILPIFVDESVHTSQDVVRVARQVDGINLKLMKSGGLTEALRIVATARAFGLQTMIGCMSESSISIAAGAAIGALFDHIDLDSHLNLDPDPATGAPIVDGVIVPTDLPGHGASLKPSYA